MLFQIYNQLIPVYWQAINSFQSKHKMSAAPASSSSPKEDSNGGSSDAASASNIHPH